MRDIDGHTYEEIAEMLDLEIGTVKSRLNRARANLREMLAVFAGKSMDEISVAREEKIIF